MWQSDATPLSLLWCPYRELIKIRLKTTIVPFEAHCNASSESFDAYIPCGIRHLHSNDDLTGTKNKRTS